MLARTLKVMDVVLAQILGLEGLITNWGRGFIVMDAEVLAVQAFAAVTVRLYDPLWFGTALFRLLFCAREKKLFGPFQTKAA